MIAAFLARVIPNVGTRSLLFGAHQVLIHPWFVAAAWWKLHGWRRVACPSSSIRTSLRDPRLWLCFLVHDWGYWGSPNMDGPEGEEHPRTGAEIAHALFDEHAPKLAIRWFYFVYYHSRHLAKSDGVQPSALCMADKLSIALTPGWLYVPLARLSGEIHEYRSRETRPETSANWSERHDADGTDWEWWRRVQRWTRDYVEAHRDGTEDTWTSHAARQPQEEA